MTLEDLYAMRISIAAKIEQKEAELARRPATTFDSSRTINSAARLYDVSPEQLLSTSRDSTVVRARQAACWLFRAQGLSLPRIGRIVGRDHATVLYACRKIDADPAVRALLWPLLERTAA